MNTRVVHTVIHARSRRCMCSSVQLAEEEQLSVKPNSTRQLEGDSLMF